MNATNRLATSLSLSLSLLLSWQGQAQAQVNKRDTIIPGQTIEIVQSYKPEIAKPVKPVINPGLPRVDTSRPIFQYVVPQQTLSYTYRSVPIRPLALGRQAIASPFQNYVKAGYGNLSSLLLDAGIGSLKTETYESAFHFYHLSQKSSLEFQQASNTALDAQGKYYTNGHALSAKVGLMRNAAALYGYAHDIFEFPKHDVRQVFLGADVKLGLENTDEMEWNLKYKPTLDAGIWGDNRGGIERHIDFDVPFSMELDTMLGFSLGVRGSLTQFKNDSFSTGNNYIAFDPSVQVRMDNANLHLGLSPTWGKNGTAYLLPDLRLNLRLFDNGLTVIGGWKGELLQYTYKQLSLKNPFLYNIFDVEQGRTDRIYAGFESALGQHISFGGTFSWRQWRHMAMFVNDYALSEDGKSFTVIRDPKVQALGLDAFIRYQIGSVFGLSGHVNWNGFYHKEIYDKVFHEPMIRMGGNMYIRPLDALHIGVGLDYWDGIYALRPNGESEKLPGFLDMSASAEYNFIPRLSLFLQLNNILGDHYQRWKQYPTYGFQVIGGLRFKF